MTPSIADPLTKTCDLLNNWSAQTHLAEGDMEITFQQKLPATARGLSGSLGDVISSLGTTDFEHAFMRLARDFCDCEHVTIFSRSKKGPPEILLAANFGTSRIAGDVGRKYVSHYWRQDPARSVPTARGTMTLLELQNLDIEDSNYRHDCYVSVGLDRRLSLLQVRPDGIVQFNAYSKGRNTRLASGMLEIAPYFEPLLLLVLKHRDLAAVDRANLAGTFQRRLRLACPSLPDREMGVCVAIAKGLSSEAMSLEWGISLNTVLTYRKRAYARLNITSHNELMHLVIGRLDRSQSIE